MRNVRYLAITMFNSLLLETCPHTWETNFTPGSAWDAYLHASLSCSHVLSLSTLFYPSTAPSISNTDALLSRLIAGNYMSATSLLQIKLSRLLLKPPVFLLKTTSFPSHKKNTNQFQGKITLSVMSILPFAIDLKRQPVAPTDSYCYTVEKCNWPYKHFKSSTQKDALECCDGQYCRT